MYKYKCIINRVIDGDTVDVSIDLGFGVWLYNERVRITGIDAPESRTSDLVEKKFGLLSTNRLIEIFNSASDIILVSEQFKGKFGRILGNFLVDSQLVSDIMLIEGYAVPYSNNDEQMKQLHLENRERLISEGLIIVYD